MVLTSPLVIWKWRETFPFLWGTNEHIQTVSEAAGSAETWTNHFFLNVLPMLPGWRCRKLTRYLLQCEAQSCFTFSASMLACISSTHFATFPLNLIALLLILKGHFPNQYKSKSLFLPLLFSFPIPFYSHDIHLNSQSLLHCFAVPILIDLKASKSSMA